MDENDLDLTLLYDRAELALAFFYDNVAHHEGLKGRPELASQADAITDALAKFKYDCQILADWAKVEKEPL